MLFLLLGGSISLRELNTCPYSGNNPKEVQLAEMLKRAFQFTDKNDRFIEKINRVFMEREVIRGHAAAFQEAREELEQKQQLLLRIVLLSRDVEKVKTAASNAISILNETGFSFYRLNLEGIHIPYAKLGRALLDEAILRRSDLTGVEVIDSSMRRTILDGSEIGGIQFGRLPFLIHNQPVLSAIKIPPNVLASNDSQKMYRWDLQTLKPQRRRTGRYQYGPGSSLSLPYSPPIFLLPSPRN